MSVRFRPYAPSDMEQYLAIANQLNAIPTTAEQFRFQEENRKKEEPFYRIVAENEGGLVGYAVANLPSMSPAGWFSLRVVTDRNQRGQGIGRMLYVEVERWALAQGATLFEGGVKDNDPASKAWLERRGFKQERHMFESTLDTTTFDLGAWEAEMAKPRQAGIEFARIGRNRSEAELRKLYELAAVLFVQMPGMDGRRAPDYDQWIKWIFKGPTSDPDGAFIAMDGDNWVGLSGCTFTEGADAYTWFTGVLPEHRGKGIALALKLLTIEHVQKRGWKRMRTNNDSENPAMLRVNEKLGYQPEPGVYFMKKRI